MNIRRKLVFVAAIIVVATLMALIFLTTRPVVAVPLPNPNGYDDFLKAAVAVEGNASDWPDLTVVELQALVATNQTALNLVSTGLMKECRVVPYTLVATTNTHLSDLGGVKHVAQLFAAASRLALLEGRTNDAAILALDGVRFGHESARGGVVIDALVGLAVQAIGLAGLERALPGADSVTAQTVVTTLEDLGNRRELVADIWKREAQWARHGRFGPMGFFTQLFQPFLQRNMAAKTEQKFIKGGTDLQRTKIHAAARAYELDHGTPPATAADLVPQYLKSIPLNPATGKELPLK